jgi:ABC-2 type transport system ATP-binding protein
MGDERRVHARLGCDRAQARTVEAALCEESCGRGGDVLASAALAAPPAGAPIRRTWTSLRSEFIMCRILHAMNSTAATIRVQGLHVRRGPTLVLPGIALEISGGVVTGLLGPSGSGKTTLMRAIVGVQVIERGEVDVLGLPAGAPELRRRVGYVTQAPSVYADLTVRENLRYFARVLGAPRESVASAIETVDLGPQADQIVDTLSGGESSRVSLATALLGDPDVLVLDEPTVGLDPVLRRDLWRTFHVLAESGKTVLVSTHVMDEAERCDDLVLLRDGRIVATGTPADLRQRADAHDLESAFLALAEAA